MHNIKLKIEYDGTEYVGWQFQPNGKNIQNEIEKCLKQILQEEITLIGAGRTDSGVHARGQVANFKTNKTIDLKKIQNSLNSLLPDDIKILDVQEVSLDFHSRYSAKSRFYTYYISTYPTALFRNFSWYLKYDLNFELLNECCKLVLGTHDFEGFSKLDENNEHYLSNVYISRWIFRKRFLKYQIEANRFLYGMVRGLVGSMIDVARGHMTLDDFIAVLDKKDRTKAGQFAPARGLFLENIKY
ncbi:MAG: tRNA pseudouridine synthase A [Ignavibacteriae bacterium]|nr:MAG: tRNA pseudouridine synthase A [Ignavibacteriota bacterium]